MTKPDMERRSRVCWRDILSNNIDTLEKSIARPAEDGRPRGFLRGDDSQPKWPLAKRA